MSACCCIHTGQYERQASFRTLPSGSYRWMKGLTRGYWRVLERDTGCAHGWNARGHVREIYTGRKGILGVTQRSRYYIGDTSDRATELASTPHEVVS